MYSYSYMHRCPAIQFQKCTRPSAQAFLKGTLHLWWLDMPEQGRDRCHQGPNPLLVVLMQCSKPCTYACASGRVCEEFLTC